MNATEPMSLEQAAEALVQPEETTEEVVEEESQSAAEPEAELEEEQPEEDSFGDSDAEDDGDDEPDDVIENDAGEDRMTFKVAGAVDTKAVEASLRDVMKVRGEVVSVDAKSLPDDGKVIEDLRRYR